MTAIKGFYESSPSTVTTGKYKTVQIDSQGRLVVSAVASGTSTVTAQGVYNATPVVIVDGAASTLQTDVNGYLKNVEQYAPGAEDNSNNVYATAVKPMSVATYSPSLYTNLGTLTKANVKASPGNVFSLVITNTNGAVRYFQLHNKATAPVATEVPQNWFVLPATTGVTIIGSDVLHAMGTNFSLGIGWAISTTVGTFTDSATASDHTVQVWYK